MTNDSVGNHIESMVCHESFRVICLITGSSGLAEWMQRNLQAGNISQLQFFVCYYRGVKLEYTLLFLLMH